MEEKRNRTSAHEDINNSTSEDSFEFYNEKKTKEAVGRLFQEYLNDGEKNYFAPKITNHEYYEDDAQNEFLETPYEEYDAYDAFDEYDDLQNPNDHYKNEYTYDTVKLYSPRRKRNTKTRGKTKPKNKHNSKKSFEKPVKKVLEHPPKKNIKKIESFPVNNFDDEFDDEDYLDDDYDNFKTVNKTFKNFILGFLFFALTISVIFLLVKAVSLKMELSDFKERFINLSNSTSESQSAKEIERLKVQINELLEENKTLKESIKNTSISNTPTVNQSQEQEEQKEQEESLQEGEYIVQKGDNLWKISLKVYQDGNLYHKILEANNMSSDDTLVTGQKLIIPPKQ